MEIERNKFQNIGKAVQIGNAFWNKSENSGMAGIVAEYKGSELISDKGHRFQNFCYCSYLDLDRHPKIIKGAIDAIRRYGALDHCITRARVQLPGLLELEHVLSDLFRVQAVTAISASVASAGVLPLFASGHLTHGKRPVMLFDKYAHFSLAAAKPMCADETEVKTIAHHDLEAIEAHCKDHQSVCYVCDGSDSLGGYAPVKELTALQERYGLYIYYDDSHSLSVYGECGQGYVRSHVPELNSRTIIVATLNKAFGTSGAVLMLGKRTSEELRIVERFAGAMSYSQPMNTAAIGASLASAELHATSELSMLQKKLWDNIILFDELCPTAQAGNTYPIRVLPFREENVIEAGQRILNAGFYASPVFFPIVPRGQAGIRVMLRSGQKKNDLKKFAATVHNEV